MKVPEKEVDCVSHETSMQCFARELASGISSEAIQRMDTHTATMMQFVHRWSEVPPKVPAKKSRSFPFTTVTSYGSYVSAEPARAECGLVGLKNQGKVMTTERSCFR